MRRLQEYRYEFAVRYNGRISVKRFVENRGRSGAIIGALNNHAERGAFLSFDLW